MIFYGMSSELAMKKYYGGKANYRASEGRVTNVAYKGPVDQTIEQILGGLRSACTYVGTNKLKNLSKCTTFIRVNRVHDNMS
jgi:GMP reductase